MFKDGRTSLVDGVRSGRPVSSSTTSNVDEIDKVIRENRRTSLNEIKERFNISYGSAWNIVHEKLGYRKVCSRWVPKQLSEQHTGCRMACSLKHLQGYNEEGNEFLASIVTGDETWTLHITPESKAASMIWKHPSSPTRKKFKVSPSTRKLMLTVFWDMKGVLLSKFLPRGSKAKDLLPRPKAGEPYQARIAPSHLNVFLNLANLISRNGTRLEEADALYKQAISMRSDYIQAYINRGDILIRLNRTREAQIVYERALEYDDGNPDIYYNLGVVFLEQRKLDQALYYFDKALKINPEHEQALLNSAILIQESGTPDMRKTAYDRLNILLRRKRVNERVYFNLGMLAMDEKNLTLAEQWFQKAVQIREDFRSALFNLALLLSEAGRPMEAIPFLHRLLQHHPDHVKGLILLGDIYINNVRDLNAAQECYENILRQDPGNIQALHNLCVVHVERGLLHEAESCLEKASEMAPNEKYVKEHLEIVRARRKLISSLSDTTTDSVHKQMR